ncbi:MAG: hypothetical protein ACXU9C_28360, partial [Xanthobacteraceae bacterium]
RSQVSAINLIGLVADLAPSISQSVTLCSSVAFMTPVFAALLAQTSRRGNARLRGVPDSQASGLLRR